MSSRTDILAAIKMNRPGLAPLPEIPSFNDNEDRVALFAKMIEAVGGTAMQVNNKEDINNRLKELQQKNVRLINTIEGLVGYNIHAYKKASATELEAVDTVFIKGKLGVAENGAVWVSESDMVNRLFPFICRHLVLVIDAKDIVLNMHEAYDRIKADEDGYGVFIAGPSKTADIEQSLVIGAHGPLGLQVFIVS